MPLSGHISKLGLSMLHLGMKDGCACNLHVTLSRKSLGNLHVEIISTLCVVNIEMCLPIPRIPSLTLNTLLCLTYVGGLYHTICSRKTQSSTIFQLENIAMMCFRISMDSLL